MSFWAKKFRNKIVLTTGAGIFLFSVFLSSFFPERAFAILGAGDTNIDITPPFTPNQTQFLHTSEKVEMSITDAILASVMSAAVQGTRYFMTKIAYDTAQYVASGGKGQSALVFKEGWGQYLQNVGGDAVGAAVSDLGGSWGLDFCNFPNIDLQLYLQLGIRQMNAPHTDCTWNDLKATYGKDAWKKRYQDAKTTAERFDSSDKVLKEFSKAVKPANTDFGIGVGALVQVDRLKQQREKSAELERSTNKGFKDLQSLISGNVMTPGEVIGQETKAQLSQVEQGKRNEISLAGIYASGAYQIIPETASMFLNTLGSSLLQRLFTQGLVPEGSDSSLVYEYGSDPGVLNSAEEAKNAYNFLFARTPSQPTDYNNVAEFAACPDNPGINNCVMDRGLQEALSRAAIDQPITIGEAIKVENGGYLNPNWPLISPRRLQENQNIQGCLSEKYCYSNIQKLRKARILPLGFEIAALRSDPDKPWTLGEVVDGFYDCHYDPNDPTKIIPDPAYPFCHLINPNWVIKAPQARCEIKVFGDALIDPASSARREECADVSTCLGKDNTGACAQFGYCTKESNVWRIGGDACPAHYSTCTTYVNTENRKINSYLSKTVDYGECSADNKGCRAYSFVATSNPDATSTSWTNSANITVGQNQVVFFNEKIQDLSSVCNANNNGCSAFYGASRRNDGSYIDANTTTPALEFTLDRNNRLNIKKAPVYLGCYDGNKQQDGTQRPTTIFEANVAASTAAACSQFASACVPEEVGCEAFTPINSLTQNPDGPMVPGKIGDNNYCAEACVGYETFKQEKTAFDAAKFPVHFIPTQAASCPSIANGCSEFTNIDAQARGGEGLEYYTDLKYCEKPTGSNVKTFYSWEGSAEGGYELLTYQLKPLTLAEQNEIARPGFVEGSPAYILDTEDALDEFTGMCDEEKYNKLLSNPNDPEAADENCRAIFDNNGNTYYRLIDKTVTVDPACHPLRKTEAVFEVDRGIDNAQTCSAKSGRWNAAGANPVCERCTNGGKFQNGFCVYQTISAPGESTSCAPEYNGCRAYSGNAAGNIEQIFLDDFEPAAENAEAFALALGEWSPSNTLRIVGEATHIQFHSLQVPAAVQSATRQLLPFEAETNGWYELSFLAKTSVASSSLVVGFKVDNEFAGQFASSSAPVRIGANWQLYKLGPIQFTSASVEDVSLAFERASGNAVYFIDQVRLRKITDFKHYIKDSWKNAPGNDGRNVPLACDSAPEDNLPGEALGCRQYNDSANIPRYATGFQSLCREKAIGCQPVWDTFNTINGGDAALSKIFNVSCVFPGGAGQNCVVRYNNQELGRCFVQPGKSSCYVPEITLPAGVNFAAVQNSVRQNQAPLQINLESSSVVIPEDTATSSPVFLALGEKQIYTCPSGAVGCRKVGQEQKFLPNTASSSFAFNDIFVKNDPESYKDTLCRNDLVGCSEFTHDNKVTYFKDPEVTGNSLCVYKPASEGISSQYGWFLKGVGKCTTSVNPQVVGDRLCRMDSDCGGDNRCVDLETVACSADNLRVGGFFDIWSNSSAQYDGNVGVCPANENTCTELIDRKDTSSINPEGKPYYVLYNDQIKQKEKLCTQVSLNDGCVLFDKTDEPNKIFDANATYLRSEKRLDQPFGPVEAVRQGDAEFVRADSNKILKVDRDRECSEWLACKSYASSIDYSGGARRETQICSQLAACNKIGVGGTCANWVDPRRPGDAQALALSRLTYDKYVTRGVSWYNNEFSGYSLYNKYQIGDMVYVKFSFPEELQPFLQSEMNQTYIVRQLRQSVIDSVEGNAFDCKPQNADENTDWKICGFGDNQVNGGRCYSNQCIYPINGSFPQNVVINLEAPEQADTARKLKGLITLLEPNSCKDTPEQDSPYPDKILKVGVGQEILTNGEVPGERRNTTFKLEGFSAANACQFGACSCAYQKVQYKNGQTDYWPLVGLKPGTVIPEGVCSGGGIKEGFPCTKNIDCVDDNGTVATEDDDFGSCGIRQNVETRIGLEGYCLEDDLSRPIFYNGQNSFACLTWLPINISASSVDIYNRDVSAGYNLQDDAQKGGGQIFCRSSTQTGAGVYDPDWMTLRPQPGSSVADQMSNLYNLYFNEDGTPKLGAYTNYNCGGALNFEQDPLPPYITTICGAHHIRDDNSNLPKQISTALYSWLYKKDLTNAALLRLEWGTRSFQNDWGNNYDNAGGQTKDNNRRIYALAPMNHGVETDENIKEFGTIMHMPRTFSEASLSENDTWLIQGDLVNPLENMGQGIDAKVHTGGYGVVDESGIRNGRGLYRSPFEKYLRENDLSKVHFLPLAYPGGADSEVPSLMEPGLLIDFDRLRRTGLPAADAVLLRDAASNNTHFAPANRFRDTVLWTYKLTDVSQSAFEFKDYSPFEQTPRLQEFVSGKTGERNRIHNRYVFVLADWISEGNRQATPNFLQQHVPLDGAEVPGVLRDKVSPAAPNSDPFTAPCIEQHNNWLAIGMDFNKDGEFLGYISRWCNYDVDDDDAGIQFAVAAVFHDRCAAFDQVYQSEGINPLSAITSKAWTNRIWSGAMNSTAQGPRALDSARPWSLFLRNAPQAPYGSVRLNEYEAQDYTTLRNYTFRTKEDGLPYACNSSLFGAGTYMSSRQCSAMLLIPLIDAAFVADMSRVNGADAAQKIDSLFAAVWKSINVNSTEINADEDPPQFGSRDTGINHVAPPKIYSLNPARCEDRDKCSAGEGNNITVNGRNGTLSDYNGDGVADEPDADVNGVADPIIAPGGTYTAEAKFFAFADDNHMPLRRVMVDWDEEGLAPVNEDKRGLYKNRKPICGTSNSGGLADVGICATTRLNQNQEVILSSTGVTCSLDKACPSASYCVYPDRSEAPAQASLCVRFNEAGDQILTDRACGAGQPLCPQDQVCADIARGNAASSLQTGALGEDYKTIRFGNTPRACVEDYFIFVHQYSCGPSNLGTKNAVLVRDLAGNNNPYFDDSFTIGTVNLLKQQYGLADNDYVCVFKPRVQVQDNWGWCNGQCTRDYNGVDPNENGAEENGCYSNHPTDVPGESHDQCNVWDIPDFPINPWSSYQSSIIVIPDEI